MSGTSTRSLRLFQLACIILLSIGFWIFRYECLDAEGAGRTCLSQVAEPVAQIVSFGTYILNRHWNYAYYEMLVVGGALALVLLSLLFRRSCSWWCVLYIAALALSGLGEYSAMSRNQTRTLLYHLGAFVAALGAFALMVRRDPELLSKGWLETKRITAKVTTSEVFCVMVILAIACVNRFYQLNTNPSGYDAEACPHRMVADTWMKIMRQEVGAYVQQSSGMSLVALHKLFTDVNHPTLFYLDERLMSVAISLLGCAVMYFFVRNLRGPYAAFLALVLYVFGPLDIDWSRLPVMHHIPVIVALLLAWATCDALRTRSWKSFFAVALLIPCTKFVYPSAKLALFGPLAAMCGVVLFQRKEWRGHYLKLLYVFLGLFLYVGLRSVVYYVVHGQFIIVAPFENPYPAEAQVSQFERIKQMLGQGLYFFYEVFFAPASPTHWTHHATVLPARSLSSVTVVFCVLVFTRLLFLWRKPEALMFMAMIVGGLIPGMATELADRRIAMSLTLCLVLGVLELTWFLDTVVARGSRILTGALKFAVPVCLIGCIGLSQTTQFFGRFNGRPIQAMAGDTVLKTLQDNTLVLYLAEERRCEMFYTLYTRMLDADRSIAFATAHEGSKNAKEQILSPEPILTSWYYTETGLAPQIDKLKQTKQWGHYLFVFQPSAERESLRALLKQTYPHGKETIVEYSAALGQRMLLYEVDNTLSGGPQVRAVAGTTAAPVANAAP
jgi:hypothetical protein